MSHDDPTPAEHDAKFDERTRADIRRGRRRLYALYALVVGAIIFALVKGSIDAGSWPLGEYRVDGRTLPENP